MYTCENNRIHKPKLLKLMYKQPTLLQPIISIQRRISGKLLGQRRWKELSCRRILCTDGEYLSIREFWRLLRPHLYPTIATMQVNRERITNSEDSDLSASERSIQNLINRGNKKKHKFIFRWTHGFRKVGDAKVGTELNGDPHLKTVADTPN